MSSQDETGDRYLAEALAVAGISLGDLRSPCRKASLVERRRIVALHLREVHGASVRRTARLMNRTRSSVMNLCGELRRGAPE